MHGSHSSSLAAFCAVFALSFATPPDADAFPRTKEKAQLVVAATLAPVDPASNASGSASVGVTRLHGVHAELLAGVGTMTLTDAAGLVVAVADFFPETL